MVVTRDLGANPSVLANADLVADLVFVGHTGGILDIALSPSDQLLASGCGTPRWLTTRKWCSDTDSHGDGRDDRLHIIGLPE